MTQEESDITEIIRVDNGEPDNFCFVHASDLHLGTPFTGIAKINEEVAAALREASLEAFRNICKLAIDSKASFLLLAGDIYDGPERGASLQLNFREELAKLSDAKIAAFIVHGNHDPVTSGWTAIEKWPDLVRLFPSKTRTEIYAVSVNEKLIATIQGISHKSRNTSDNLAVKLFKPSVETFNIGLLHCNVTGVSEEHLNYAPCTRVDLINTQLDYLALGHIHKHLILSGSPDSGEPWIVYSGNSQGRSLKQSELGPKGACLVKVKSGRVQKVDLLPCDQVRYLRKNIDISGIAGFDTLYEECEKIAYDTWVENGKRCLILRAKLTGKTSLYKELRSSNALDEVIDKLNRDTDIENSFIWWESIENLATPPIDIDLLANGNDFIAELIKTAKNPDIPDGESLRDFYLDQVCGNKNFLDIPRDFADRISEILSDKDTLADLIDKALYAAIDMLNDDDGSDND